MYSLSGACPSVHAMKHFTNSVLEYPGGMLMISRLHSPRKTLSSASQILTWCGACCQRYPLRPRKIARLKLYRLSCLFCARTAAASISD